MIDKYNYNWEYEEFYGFQFETSNQIHDNYIYLRKSR